MKHYKKCDCNYWYAKEDPILHYAMWGKELKVKTPITSRTCKGLQFKNYIL